MKRLRTIAILLAAGLVAGGLIGCSDELEIQGPRCPAGASFDSELDRCVLSDGGDTENQGGGAQEDAGSMDDTGPEQDPPATDAGGDPGTDAGGEPGTEQDTGGGEDPPDTGGGQDPEDTGPQDPCDGVSCGSNASCDGGVCACNTGFQGDATAGCVAIPACGEDGCEYGAWCDDGQCVCKWGFTASGDGCQRDSVSSPDQRSEAQVCQAWNQRMTTQSPKWETEPVEQCDWGVLHPNYHRAAMQTMNVYRWLIGLEAAAADDFKRNATQACATIHAAIGGGLTHYPDESAPCYTQEGYNGAASSNLVPGSTAVTSLPPFFNSVPHRRWIFSPGLRNSAFGSHSGYVCLYVTDIGATQSVDFVAYPSPGYFPVSAIHGQWMVYAQGWGLSSSTEVEITRQSDATAVTVSNINYYGGAMGRPPAVTFTPSGAGAGDTYEVRVTNLNQEPTERTYSVTLVSC